MNDIPSDVVFQFFKRNRTLTKFSMLGKPSAFNNFASKIILGNTNAKIRNRTLHFIINREADSNGSSMKYVLRQFNWRNLRNFRITKTNWMECCTYDEFRATTYRYNDKYVRAVADIMEQRDYCMGKKKLTIE